ncbi:hypothetical protein [Burkholderia anthina]|uniref:Uncharacterized protein n=1 Tax=Burkholderia anthina TaxID=179879 RepID=A0A6P2GDQ2_9BURK|nr:hypothetical protein [Burkholderia anthina]MBM2769898.1 hypothetical protein [Burkholderia anthina]VVU51873.1 hypothetical protein BAN20980_04596 [Burkholderia anthina]
MEANQKNEHAEPCQRNPATTEEVKRITRDTSQHPTYPRRCLSCGAKESLDGSVPCGH